MPIVNVCDCSRSAAKLQQPANEAGSTIIDGGVVCKKIGIAERLSATRACERWMRRLGFATCPAAAAKVAGVECELADVPAELAMSATLCW